MRPLLSLALIAVFGIFTASAQNIPNPNFDDWTSNSIPSYDDPDDWGTVNSQTAIIGVRTVQQGTGADAYNGSFSVRLQSIFISFASEVAPGITVTGQFNTNTRAVEKGFIYTQRPYSMRGWYKYAPQGSDSCNYEVELWRWNGATREVVATALFTDGQSISTFTQFEAVFDYQSSATPDSARIVLSSSRPLAPVDGSVAFVDALEFYTPPLEVTKDSTNSACAGVCNGGASVTVTSGVSPYTYAWDANAGSATTASVANLCAGGYSVTVTDAAGQTETLSFNIEDETAFALPLTSSRDENCGLGDGEASVDGFIASGNPPVGPYTYLWDANTGGQTNDTATGLSSGSYSFTVTSSAGCTASATVTVNSSGGLTGSADFDGVTCFGDSDGKAWATPSGGTAPYTYLWDANAGNATTDTVTGLAGGTYSVTISDDAGCDFSTTVTVVEPGMLGIGVTPTSPSCYGACDGELDIGVAGGTEPYTYLWSTGSTLEDLELLCAGNYDVTVTDANGCTAADGWSILNPDSISVTITTTDVSCNGECDGTIDITATGGTTPYTFDWSNGANSEDVTDLCPGNYSVTITDANGCMAIASADITEPTAISLSLSSTDASSVGGVDGSASVTASGGISPYTYQWSSLQGIATATGLSAGIYTVTVTDYNGCIAVDSIEVSDPVGLNILNPNDRISIYPNPAKDLITIQVLDGQNRVSYKLTDLSGRLVTSGIFTDETITISVATFAPGMYIIELGDGGNTVGTQKVMVLE